MFRSVRTLAGRQVQGDFASNADGLGQQFFAATAERSSAVARSSEDAKELDEFVGRLNETGILPLKIQLPKSGSVYRFSRLMTSQDALALEATFAHPKMPLLPFAAPRLRWVPMGGVALSRVRRR